MLGDVEPEETIPLQDLHRPELLGVIKCITIGVGAEGIEPVPDLPPVGDSIRIGVTVLPPCAETVRNCVAVFVCAVGEPQENGFRGNATVRT